MRWCVVMRDLNTTTQLVLVVLSNRESASWGMLTFISLVQWIKSGNKRKKTEKSYTGLRQEDDVEIAGRLDVSHVSHVWSVPLSPVIRLTT